MKNIVITSHLMFTGLFLIVVWLITSCKPVPNKFGPAEASAVRDSLSKMTARIALDVSAKGPAAWLNYFEDTPDFFMASGGQLMFKDHATAQTFIPNTLAKLISKINLRWYHVRVDALSADWAAIGSDFHEDLTYVKGMATAADGYFTATAHHTPKGWMCEMSIGPCYRKLR